MKITFDLFSTCGASVNCKYFAKLMGIARIY